MQHPPRRLVALACLHLAFLLACGEERPTTFVEAGTMDAPDVSPDATRPRDVEMRDAQGRVCTRSTQCDDGIPCTMDFCSPEGRCVSLPDTQACDDGVYCNGLEFCDVRRGCVRGTPVACNDNYTCTIDRCDEETRRCVHSPRDFDRDGDPDIRCRAAECSDAGASDGGPDGGGCWIGGDCDDSNPRVNSRLPELCGDMIDNNCNGQVDSAERGGCMRPPHDTCDDPMDVSRGGRFTFQTLGTMGNYMFRCAGGVLMRDVVARLRLTEPRDVTLTASSQGGAVYVQLMANTCGMTSNAMDIRACTLGFPTVVRKRALPAGDYYILLGTSSSTAVSAEFELNVELAPATPVPPNDTCMTPTVIPSTGGTFRGDLIDLQADVNTQCAGRQSDAVYALTLTEASNVVARVTTTPSSSIGLALVDRCVASPMTLRCDFAAPAQWTARQLAPGTYFLVVNGSTLNPYTLDVMVTPPSPPPQGDSCANPLTVTSGMPVMGSLAMMEADYQLSCSGTGNRDVVYRFTLTEQRDVNVVVTGSASEYFYVALQTMCGVRTSDRVCRFGQPGRLTVRGLDPGTYYLVIKGTRGGDYTLRVDATPPVSPIAVTGNDTCETAAVIPSGGGVFTGTTATARRDYTAPCSPGSSSEDVVFRYRVDRAQRVSFSLDGSSFDTLMWLTSGSMCPGTNVPGACNDDAIGLASAFDVTLMPGDYHLFIGGFGSGSRGNYVLTVTPSSL
jgi:hypothetical protein